MSFKVTNEGSIIVDSRKNTILKPGEKVPDGMLTKDQIEEHVRSGFLEYDGQKEKTPVRESLPPIGIDGTPGGKKISWKLNPKDLSNKTVPQLNEIIAKKDPTVRPFETKEEALAYMCQDLTEE